MDMCMDLRIDLRVGMCIQLSLRSGSNEYCGGPSRGVNMPSVWHVHRQCRNARCEDAIEVREKAIRVIDMHNGSTWAYLFQDYKVHSCDTGVYANVFVHR